MGTPKSASVAASLCRKRLLLQLEAPELKLEPTIPEALPASRAGCSHQQEQWLPTAEPWPDCLKGHRSYGRCQISNGNVQELSCDCAKGNATLLAAIISGPRCSLSFDTQSALTPGQQRHRSCQERSAAAQEVGLTRVSSSPRSMSC